MIIKFVFLLSQKTVQKLNTALSFNMFFLIINTKLFLPPCGCNHHLQHHYHPLPIILHIYNVSSIPYHQRQLIYYCCLHDFPKLHHYHNKHHIIFCFSTILKIFLTFFTFSSLSQASSPSLSTSSLPFSFLPSLPPPFSMVLFKFWSN